MRNAYIFTITDENGDSVDVALRLTVSGQMELKKKYKKSTMETIFEAPQDVEVMCDVLTQSLKYNGNTNKITSGSKLYDLMVENGFGGVRKWQTLMNEIAYASGILDKEEKKQFDEKVQNMYESTLNGDTEKNA